MLTHLFDHTFAWNLETALWPFVEFAFFNQYIFWVVLCRYQKNDTEKGCRWKPVKEVGERDPKVREIIYNYTFEKSAPSPNRLVFLTSAKHPSISSLTWGNLDKSNTYQVIYGAAWTESEKLNLSCDIIHLIRQDWAWSKPPERAFRIGSPLCTFGGDVIVSLSLGGCQELW